MKQRLQIDKAIIEYRKEHPGQRMNMRILAAKINPDKKDAIHQILCAYNQGRREYYSKSILRQAWEILECDPNTLLL